MRNSIFYIYIYVYIYLAHDYEFTAAKANGLLIIVRLFFFFLLLLFPLLLPDASPDDLLDDDDDGACVCMCVCVCVRACVRVYACEEDGRETWTRFSFTILSSTFFQSHLAIVNNSQRRYIHTHAHARAFHTFHTFERISIGFTLYAVVRHWVMIR